MDAAPRQKLSELITTYGHTLLDDPGRCEGLLRDVCGQYRREITVLVSALKEGVGTELLTASEGVPIEVLLARQTQRLQDDLGLTADAGRWAVESWALALGRLSPKQARGFSVPIDARKADIAPPQTSPQPGLLEALPAAPTPTVATPQGKRKWPVIMGVFLAVTVIAAVFAVLSTNHEREREAEERNRGREEQAHGPLDRKWRLRWWYVDGVLYDSILQMRGDSGIMLTTYQHPLRGLQRVRQTMQFASFPAGNVLIGSNPIDLRTQMPAGEYAPDNFLLIQQPDGSTRLVLCDMQALQLQNLSLCVPVTVTQE